jgi:hypothetical protein
VLLIKQPRIPAFDSSLTGGATLLAFWNRLPAAVRSQFGRQLWFRFDLGDERRIVPCPRAARSVQRHALKRHMAIDSVESEPYEAPLRKAIARYVDRTSRTSPEQRSAESARPVSACCDDTTAGNATLSIGPLKAVAFVRAMPDWAEQFPLLDVALEIRPRSELSASHRTDGGLQVVVIELDGLNQPEWSVVQALAQISGYACAGLTDASTYQELATIAADLDAVGPATNTPHGIGWLIRTAYVQAFEKRRYRGQLLELQETMRRKELISRAKSIIAEQGRISEADALRQLRIESRKQRRPMWELSQLIVDAYSVMCPRPDNRRDEKLAGFDGEYMAEFEDSD